MKKYFPILVFALLSLWVFPFFTGGYFFLLDDFFPSLHTISNINHLTQNSSFLFLSIFNAVSWCVPVWLVQRFFYIGTFFLLGLSGYSLLYKQTQIGAYFAGILLMFNPYVYDRILNGQMGIVAGITCLVFCFASLGQFLQTRRYRPLFLSAVFAGFSVMWMPHAIFFVFLAFLVFMAADCLKNRHCFANAKAFAVLFGMVLFLNAPWIVNNFAPNGSIRQTVSQISADHFRVFATDPGNTNVYFNALALRGFWGERNSRYVPAYFGNAYWQAVFCTVFVLVLVWLYWRLTNKKNSQKSFDVALFATACFAYMLTLWISQDNLFAPITQFLYRYVPFYTALRESEKWSGVLLIAYAYFAWYAVQAIVNHPFIQKGYPKIIAVTLIALPVLYTPAMLFGFRGQLFVADYPTEWYALRNNFSHILDWWNRTDDLSVPNCDFLTQQKSTACYNVLALPWHQYIGLRFARNIIANPVSGFFYNVSVLQGDNMEIGGIYTQSVRNESKIIERYFWPQGVFANQFDPTQTDAFIRDLRWLGIQAVLLLKESDFPKYQTVLQDMVRLQKIRILQDNAKFTLFIIG